MKLLVLACLTFASFQAIHASSFTSDLAPAFPTVSEPENVSINEAELALATLERRLSCIPLKRTLNQISTSEVKMIFMLGASNLALEVCKLAHGQDCIAVAHIVQFAITLIYAASRDRSGAVPILPTRRDMDALHPKYLQYWEQTLGNSTALVTYDRIISVPLSDAEEATTTKASKRESGGTPPALLSRVHIAGLQMQNATTGSGNSSSQHILQDVMMNLFADGTTLIHIPLPDGEAASTVADSTINSTGAVATRLSKHFSRPGFKVSYTTRIPSRLTASHQRDMAFHIAKSWALCADNYHMNELIGFSETGHQANFNYRIIPELRGFGTEYESVDVCGGVSSFL